MYRSLFMRVSVRRADCFDVQFEISLSGGKRMSKKLLSLVLVGLLLNIVGVIPAYASSKEETRARFAEKVKEGISKLGTGPEARVEVKLRDGRKLKGYISETGENSFVVVDAKSGVASTIPYPQVNQ